LAHGFVFMGAMTLLPLPAVFFWLQERRFAAGRKAPQPEVGDKMFEALRRPTFWLLGGGCLLYFLSYNGIQFGLIPLLTHEGLSGPTPRIMRASWAFLFGGKLVSGVTFDRFRMPFVLATVLVADAVAFVALALLRQSGVVVSLAIIGFAHGSMMNGFPYSVARYFGVKFFGGISGLISVLLSLSSFGALLFSNLRDGSVRTESRCSSLVVSCWGVGVIWVLGFHPYYATTTARF